ncbi:hypothetical protein [Aliarcobacter skirrowii]|uniref:hypothetical protein n=1 Tax=Aliarcobacter skirrowii TaxID=28200 RepID=UPI0008335181|nr:hypothetical protein [Aliarcobacter skirrowii]
MKRNTIFQEETIKLKTKVLIFSGISLFVGLSETLPSKISLIGLNLVGKECIVGWFLFIITSYLLTHFLLLVTLDLIRFFKKHIVNVKARNFTGNCIGLTYKEIGEEYERQHEYNDNRDDEDDGTLSGEASDITRQIKVLEDRFDSLHLGIYNIINISTDAVIPFILGIIGLKFLYCFLIL